MRLKKTFLIPTVILTSIVPIIASCGVGQSIDKIKADALPSVSHYDDIKKSKYKLDVNSKLILDSTITGDKESVDAVNNMVDKISAKLSIDNLSISNGNGNDLKKKDIYIKIVPHLNKYPQVQTNEGYQIVVSNTVKIYALGSRGVVWALTTLLQMQIRNHGIYFGTITDWPKVSERGIQFDCNDGAHSLNFVSDMIREMSWDKLNTLALQFGSGSMCLATGRAVDGHPSNPYQTWFTATWDDSTPDKSFDLNASITDTSKLWCWDGGYSPFGQMLKMAKVNGVSIVPSIEIFNHAQFITNLTQPIDNNGKPKPDSDISSQEREDDFAYYDDSTPQPHRCEDIVNLTNLTSGSRAASSLIEQIVKYFAEKFKEAGINTLGFGGDEYIEEMVWGIVTFGNIHFNSVEHKQQFVDGFYNLLSKVNADVAELNVSSRLWNDNLFRNDNDQDPEGTQRYFPKASPGLQDAVDKNMYIQYWWKGKETEANLWGANAIASVDDYINHFKFVHMINYDFNDLYFCDDQESSVIPDPRSLFETWDPGMFPKNWETGQGVYQIYHENNQGNYPIWLTGAMFSVWMGGDHILTKITYEPLKALSQKCWNGSDKTVDFNYFRNTYDKLGHAPLLV